MIKVKELQLRSHQLSKQNFIFRMFPQEFLSYQTHNKATEHQQVILFSVPDTVVFHLKNGISHLMSLSSGNQLVVDALEPFIMDFGMEVLRLKFLKKII